MHPALCTPTLTPLRSLQLCSPTVTFFLLPFAVLFCDCHRLALSAQTYVLHPSWTQIIDALRITVGLPFLFLWCCCSGFGSFSRHYPRSTSSSAMEFGYPDSSAPTAGSPALPADHVGSPFRGPVGSPQSPASAQDGSASPASFSVNMSAGQPSQARSPPRMSGAGMSSAPLPAATAAVRAPWDEDDNEWGAPSAPVQNPPGAAALASLPSHHENHGTPLAPVAAQPNPGSPEEPRPTPVAMSQPASDGFIASSPPDGSPNSPPTPPEKPSTADSAKMEALKKQIARRTAAIDAATKAKETQIIAAAQEYLKAIKVKREQEVMTAKASHKQEQQAGAKKIDDCRKSGAVWNAVGMLVDLQRPNQYSKSTEQMRSVLSSLSATPVKK
ncbi:hypothetical protein LSCM1_06198 [Leishmania martiniquensis]|uniref:Clathrin light chain n=1 Tax=Leishmania martiniquensis TaxID=1580590 RepID=A0A836HAC2_9TRYP|nr:hypothetical protein LSCM1_06198 [Leishmania martiniquensis]